MPGTEQSTPDRLVNGEAVEVDIRYARLGSRALALLIDAAIQVVLAFFLFLVVFSIAPFAFGDLADGALTQAMSVVIVVVVVLAYPTVVETVTNGRSPGKRALGLRVVRADGGPIRLRHALTRALVGLTLEWPGLIMPFVTWVVSMTTMILSPHGRRLGDLAAGTFVVHERSAAEWGWMPAMPTPLAGWASTADLNSVDDDLALAARHFLARSRDILPVYAHRFADGLADEMTARIPQPPPSGTPSWMLLAAVLAERRRRASGQQLTTRALTERIWPGFGRIERFTRSQALGSADTQEVQPLP
ncbi:RDD family protein [Actinoplanes sp. NPDC049265]|uniref:RDD family protein n=1 Tax=Actinoplanes sp. NPDC049265 TaxID=3363902 RepID=UPI003723F503